MGKSPALSKELGRHKKTYILGSDEPEDPINGYALILTFRNADMYRWSVQHPMLIKTLRLIGFSAKTLYMDSEDFRTHLQKFLDGRFRRPRIIFVAAHGGENSNGLNLSAGAKSSASIPWSTIRDIVTPAKCDVLLIPWCCQSGLASIKRQNIYAKEVLIFSGWNEDLYGAIRHARDAKSKEYHGRVYHVYAELREVEESDISMLENKMWMLEVGSKERRIREREELRKAIAEELEKLHVITYMKDFTQASYVQEDIDWEAGFKLDPSGKLRRVWKLLKKDQ